MLNARLYGMYVRVCASALERLFATRRLRLRRRRRTASFAGCSARIYADHERINILAASLCARVHKEVVCCECADSKSYYRM